MSIRTLLVSTGLLIACGGVHSQPTVPPGVSPPPGVGFNPPPAAPTGPSIIPSPATPLPTVPAVPREKSVDDLLAELENIHSQKAALEKKEQELTAALRKKLQAQAERLQKLGVMPKDAKPGVPDRVGKIILEGNAEKDEKKILDAVGLQPGQVLQYPALEAARAKLEKTGFRGATVEVVPNELDSEFKDIRVRVSAVR